MPQRQTKNTYVAENDIKALAELIYDIYKEKKLKEKDQNNAKPASSS